MSWLQIGARLLKNSSRATTERTILGDEVSYDFLMGVNVQIRRNGKAQLRVTHRLLPKPFFFTFDDAPQAQAYGAQLHALLQKGVVPAELLAHTPDARADNPALLEMVRAYTKGFPVTDSDAALLQSMSMELVGVRWRALTYRWVDEYVASLKRAPRRLAPGSIRKRVGVLARVVDYWLRVSGHEGANPFRLLPRGYSVYSAQDEAQGVARHDAARDRRLTPQEVQRIDEVLAGAKRDDRQRAWGADEQFTLLYRMLVLQGLRLREAVTARVEDVDFSAGVMTVRGSKGARGRVKPRQMPLHPDFAPMLAKWCEGRGAGLVFDFWPGDDAASLRRACNAVSARLATLFAYAGAPDVRGHDLRHEACCRWMGMRDAAGGWLFSEIEICRMFGWTDPKIMMRYASVRGADLAARLRQG